MATSTPTARPTCKHPGCTELAAPAARGRAVPRTTAKDAATPACRPGASAAA